MDTSWQKVGDTSHYSHHNLVGANALKLLNLKSGDSLLDIGCGQGIFAKTIPEGVRYLGIDNAPGLIGEAQKADKNPLHKFMIANAAIPINSNDKFTHAIMLLSLQNMEDPEAVIRNASQKVESGGKLLIIINHPMFRIPRQTSWETDLQNKTEYRRINRYLSPLKIPINTHPGLKNSNVTWSFHHSLSDYSKYLNESKMSISLIEEWASDKKVSWVQSEFPMFMAILAYGI